MRIGINIRVPDDPNSGQQRYLWRLGTWLADRGHAVHFITFLDRSPGAVAPAGAELHRLGHAGRSEFVDAVRGLELDALLLNPERSRRYKGVPANVLRPGYGTEHYRQNLRSFRTPLAALARRAAWLMPWAAIERRAERWFYEVPDPAPQVIAISRYMRREILASYDVRSENVHVIHNGVDLEEFNPGRRAELRAEMRRRWGIPRDAVCALFVGYNYRRKGLWPLLAGLRRVREDATDANVHLLVAGRGIGRRQPSHARRLVRRYGLGGMVHFAGTVSPVVEAYAAADMFAFLSWHDAFGFVTLEAMACGLPVILSPYVGANELVTEGVEGMIVDPEDTAAVSAAIRRLLDPAVRSGMGEAAAAIAKRWPETENFRRVEQVCRLAAERAPGPVG